MWWMLKDNGCFPEAPSRSNATPRACDNLRPYIVVRERAMRFALTIDLEKSVTKTSMRGDGEESRKQDCLEANEKEAIIAHLSQLHQNSFMKQRALCLQSQQLLSGTLESSHLYPTLWPHTKHSLSSLANAEDISIWLQPKIALHTEDS